MKFYTVYKDPRPIRLSETTRQFAFDSLENHAYGLEAMKTPAVTMDHIEGFADLPLLEKERLYLREIVEKCPIRLIQGERICGAATLGLAIHHVIPATYGGSPVFSSISPLTMQFSHILDEG
ncbi:MAG: hypothetical protein J6K29_09905, partial [Clostridia bacterium]|nr:hypothetical protein [Clostridia bacterium]